MPAEVWIIVLDVPSDGVPPAATMKRLLKHIWRSWNIRCRGFSQDRKINELEGEIERLQRIIDGLTERIAQPSGTKQV